MLHTDHYRYVPVQFNTHLDTIHFDILSICKPSDPLLSERLHQIADTLKSVTCPLVLPTFIVAIRVENTDIEAVTSELSVQEWSEVADTLGSFQNLTSLKVELSSRPVKFDAEGVLDHIRRAFSGLEGEQGTAVQVSWDSSHM